MFVLRGGLFWFDPFLQLNPLTKLVIVLLKVEFKLMLLFLSIDLDFPPLFGDCNFNWPPVAFFSFEVGGEWDGVLFFKNPVGVTDYFL